MFERYLASQVKADLQEDGLLGGPGNGKDDPGQVLAGACEAGYLGT